MTPPTFKAPLQRLAPEITKKDGEERYEVMVVGAGPAGILLDVLLARYGLNDGSLLCIDANSSRVDRGRADGMQPRTLEVLHSIGVADRILREGRQLWEFVTWESGEGTSIKRSSITPTSTDAARFTQAQTISQGILEGELEADLLKHSQRGVQRNSQLVDVKIDDEGDPEFPVVTTVEVNGTPTTIRAKFLVAADGARSSVRKCMGLRMEGDSKGAGDVWGAIDVVVETDFPDIQRRCFINSQAGTVYGIPREQVAPGDYLTRFYVDMKEYLGREQAAGRNLQGCVTLDAILQHITEVFKPFRFQPKGGRDAGVHWWSEYRVAQRVLPQFIVPDSGGMSRIFFIGDSCHTHSPKAGQGMNVSMMDAYNLSWKLAYAVLGLAPSSSSASANEILQSYHTERFSVARQLIEFDRYYCSVLQGAQKEKRAGGDAENKFSSDLVEVYRRLKSFICGYGVEYPESSVCRKSTCECSGISTDGPDHSYAVLKPGRRLLNVQLKRYADGGRCNLHDDLPSNGRFKILVFASTDLLDPDGQSACALRHIASTILPKFPRSTIQQAVVYPAIPEGFGWESVPHAVKELSEMRFYNGTQIDDVYVKYGVSANQGAWAVVRPDGYVGSVGRLGEIEGVEEFLRQCIVSVTRG